uniref:1-phosphatidylinositol 4-kinase n=1 Tax=Cajanus cajan TaxID=3821 RepID=A0A151SCU3_CAJCA|nr:hypothetical protein KK1_025375 [Cajanus cajan]
MSVADVAVRPVCKESVHWQGHCSGESILIYVTADGAVTPMRVLESDSIASVKMRIQSCKGIAGKKHKLVYGGRELVRKDALIKDYGVTAGNVLHLVLRLSDMIFIVVRTTCGKEFEFQIDRHRNVGYLKQRIKKKGKGFIVPEGQELFCGREELHDQRLFRDLCKSTDEGVIHLVVKKSAKVKATSVHKDLELSVVADDGNSGVWENQIEETPKIPPRDVDFWLEPIFVNPKVNFFPFLWDMISSTFDGLKEGNHPIRSSEGTGGTYFMQDSTGMEYVSVFKPMDEEPMAVNNPQGLPISSNGEGLKRGTKVGEGAVREVAAYILDHPMDGPRMVSDGFGCSSKHFKMGSLQMFMNNDGNCEDLGPGAFSVEEVHKITVLDLRIANADRHAGNILFRKDEGGRTVLIPIDHGYCLPEKFEDCTFDWLYWPQARKPYSPDIVKYIKRLDAEKDIELLKYYGWDVPVECAQTLRISTMLLKKGVERGLSPYDIGSIMENLNKESVIEEIICEAQESLLPGMGEFMYLEFVSKIMDSHLDKLSK